MRVMLLVILLALAAIARPGGATEPPVCNAASLGVLACIAGKSCRCHFARGGSLSAAPAGYRWDCGALRPYCPKPVEATPRISDDGPGRVVVIPHPPRQKPRPRY